MDIKEEIIKYANSIGLDTIGIIKCRIFEELREFFSYRQKNNIENEFEEHDIEKRVNPFIYMENGKTIISIAFPYEGNAKSAGRAYFSSYTMGCDYHKVVGAYMEKICTFIREKFKADAEYFVDSNSLPERYIAYLSGVGKIGRNGMIITENHGSYVFLGEIITSLEIEDLEECSWEDISKFNICGDCKRCYSACPTSVLSCEGAVPNKCMSYITQKKEIDYEDISKMNGRLFGCDTCQRCCPHNNKDRFSPLNEFSPFNFMKEPDTKFMMYMSNKEFKEKYAPTSCGWRGKAVLQRNAIIYEMMMNKNYDIDEKKISSPMVKSHYEKIINRR